jgi:flavin-dependent dehydrogenase
MTTSVKPHVLIIGAGLGGLTLAQGLRKKGISFDIFERDESPDARQQGWAIGLHTYVHEPLAPTRPFTCLSTTFVYSVKRSVLLLCQHPR